MEADKKRRDVCESYPFFYDVGYKFSARCRINSVKKEKGERGEDKEKHFTVIQALLCDERARTLTLAHLHTKALV